MNNIVTTLLKTFVDYLSIIKQYFLKILFLFSFFILFLPTQVKAEGSPQIYVGSNATGLLLCNNFDTQCNNGNGDRTQFAIYDCDSLDRLFFDINTNSETVYIGFQPDNGWNWHIVYRIKDVDGAIVKPEENMPTGGIGYINDITAAREGPEQLTAIGGYPAIEWDPPEIGTYYIEFNRVPNSGPGTSQGTFEIELFDITVATTTPPEEAIPGRLYSHAWQLDSYSPGPSCSGKFYVYSTDSIITSLELNSMQGGHWFLYCNQNGVGNTGNFNEDRKSKPNHQAYFPEYRVFLNEPDTLIFPPAETLGNLIPPVTGTAFCNSGEIDFEVEVDKAGNVEIELDFDPPYVTRSLTREVIKGVNTITWDGLDGTTPIGVPVPNNEDISFTVSYINGLTNLPLYDIESNNQGFVIELVYPEPSPDDSLFVYWDDSNIGAGGGGVNLTGCYPDPGPPWSGCHTFSDGDHHTMNTWWYTASESTAPVIITEQRHPDSLTFVQTPPQSVCAGETGIPFSVTMPNPSTEIYHWDFTGTGGTFVPPNPTGSSVTIDFATNATPGNILVWGENSNCGMGDTSYIPILVQQSATAYAGADAGICESDTYALSDATADFYQTLTWTTSGDGSFDDINLLNATYTPGANDITTGTVDLTITTTSISPCTDFTTDDMTLSIGPASTSDAGSDETICENSSLTLSGIATAYSAVLWTTAGDGSFDDATIPTATYTPGTADITSGSVVLTFTASSIPPCTSDASDDMTITIQNLAIADAGSNDNICEDSNYTLAGIASNESSVLWSTSGDGSFDDPTLLNATYTPGANDILAETVDLSFTAFAIAPCTDDSTDIMTLSIQLLPTAYAGTDTLICETGSITLSGNATDQSSSEWTTAGDGTFDDPYILNATYTPGPSDITNLSVDLTLTAVSTTPCGTNASDLMVLSIQNTAIADAGSDESICERDTLDLSLSTILPTATYYDSLKWIGGLGSFDDSSDLAPKYIPAVLELGQIDLSLIAYGTPPCGNDTSTMTLTVLNSPEVDFTKNPNSSICVNEVILFNGTSTTTINSWAWDYGDGNSDNQQNVNHYYTQDGLYDVQLLVTNDDGCKDSITYQHEVFILPEAGFSISPNDTICAELPLTFTDTSTTTIISREWNFGDGSPTESSANVTHTYSAPGDYNVTLIVENDNTCLDTIIKQVHIYSLPVADFSLSPQDTTCTNDTLSFNAWEVSGGITAWDWEFGDGNTGSGQNTTHSYTQEGDYTILLIYTNGNGCTDTAMHQIRIEELDFSFTRAPSPSCQNYIVDFHGIDYNGNTSFTSWEWDFGDGVGTATGQDVSYTYTQSGTFDVTLSLCSEQVVLPITVNPICQVFAGNDTATCEDVSIDLSTLEYEPYANNTTSIFWYSHNGLGSFDNPNAVAPVYTPDINAGSTQIDTVYLYMVGNAMDPCQNDTSVMMLRVVTGAYAYAGSNENSCFGEPFHFSTASSTSFATNYVNLYWTTSGTGSFINPNVEQPVYIPGTGEVGPVTLTMVASNIISCDSIDDMILNIRPEYLTTLNPVLCYHDSLYAQGAWRYTSGVFYDTLQSVYGCDSVIETDLFVWPDIDIDFTIDPGTTICLGEIANFTMTGTANLTSWLWDFGDGSTSSNQNPTHEYLIPGFYDVVLYYTDDNGCSDTTTYPISVFTPPDVGIIATPTTACVNTPIDFLGTSTSNIVLWEWDFDDGTTAAGQNVTHSYSQFGDMIVSLTVTDDNGCSSTALQNIEVVEPPTADFSWNILVCDTLGFTDLSTAPAGYNIVWRHWDFGDGSDTTNWVNPVHVFPGGGIYNVTLTVRAESGVFSCTDSITKQVLVPYNPTIYYTWTPEPTCLGDSTYFWGTSGNGIANWFWDFDDGYYGTTQQASHQYADTGAYNVILTITDTNGCVNSLANIVNVTEIPDVSFTMSTNPGCANNVIEFFGSSTSQIDSWHWEFGDGAFSDLQNPIHSYSSSGTYYISLTVTDTAGCTNTDTQFIIISEPPIAEFSSSVFQCSEMSFTDLSTAPTGYYIASHFWDFGDGNTSTEANPNHTYATGGFYTVTLVVTADSSTYSCVDSVEHLVTVPNGPSVYYTWSPEPTCLNDTTYFFGTSGDSISQWYWDFGDGYSAYGQNVSHAFDATGSYDVTLTVNDSLNCPSSILHTVTVTDIPDVSYTVSANPGCVDNPIFFTGQSSSGIEFWDWDFGDGSQSNIQNPLHSFTASGTYYITLTVTDSAGCSNSETQYVIITDNPEADYSYSVYQCTTMSFTDLTVAPSGAVLVEWLWDFGDGNTSSNQNPTHDFTTGGFYDVSMIVTSQSDYGNYCVDSVTYTILVPNNPSVYFSWSPEPTYLGDVTSFFGTSGATVTDWYWDFDDGYFSTLQNPAHTFNYTGTFNVSLTITDINGCESSISHNVTVVGDPDIDMTIDQSPTCIDQQISFTGISSAQIETWHWDFGDGGYSNLQNPVHVYTEEGTYTVTLDITDIYGGTNSLTEYVTIRPRPVPFFDDNSPVCNNAMADFTDLSYTEYGYITTWVWNYDDGSDNDTIYYPDNPNTSHLFPDVGTYGVTLTIISSLGCDESFTREIEIYPNPIANFQYSTACQNMVVDFSDASTPNGPGNIISWFWRFDDPLSGTANTSSLQNPSHIFVEEGDYDVMLIIENFNQCMDTIIQTVTVNPEPDVEFTWDISCENQLTQFNIDTDITNTATISDYYWEFGDGQTSSAQNPEHLYEVPGEYTVTLTVTDIEGCENDVSHLIDVHPSPVVGFSYSTPACQNSEVQFMDVSSTASGYIQQWVWDLGDGTTITIDYPDSPDITHTYETSGTFQVDLWVITTDSCENSASQNVVIADSPLADFDFEDACGNQPVQFTDNSTAVGGYAISQWEWDFGDPASGNNNYSSMQNPTHSFTQAGTYDVSLIVMNTEGCSDTIIQQVVSAELPPVDFTTSTPTCFDDLTYFYVDSVLMDIDAIVSFEWNFGDGSPVSNQQNPTYLYPTAGDFNVTLSVIDTGNCENSISHIVTISPKPQAIFDYSSACQNDTTYFTDFSSSASGDPIIEWAWDFGDPASGSNTSTLQNPIHVYTETGTYQVQLIVTCMSGCTDSLSRDIIVNPLPTANFNYIVDNCETGIVYFTDSSYANQTSIAQWFWTFEPGYNSTLRNPVHNYNNDDTCYAVSLEVTDGRGCQQTYVDTICISAELSFDFTFTPSCFGQTTSFTPQLNAPSGDTLIMFNWNFGDPASGINNTSNIEFPTHVFTSPGAYTVSLEAMDQNGCTQTVYNQIIVENLPLPDFTYESNICDSLVFLDDLSDGNGAPIASWTWVFGDGTPDQTINAPDDPDIYHAYSNAGFYDVTLIVTNTNGCRDSISMEIFREYCIKADFEVSDTLLCQNLTLNFSDSSIYSDVISQWYWDFGDGYDTTYFEYSSNITHIFTQAGTFDIRLIVYSDIGGETISDTIMKEISILPSPIAGFNCDPVCFNEISYFEDISIENGTDIVSWLWDFNDPDSLVTSTIQNPWYHYNIADSFDVKLFITAENACYDSIIQTVAVNPLPIADFEWINACMSKSTDFTDLSDSVSGLITNWGWNFGDSLTRKDTSSFPNPSYIYDTTGTYQVRLIVSNENTCVDTSTQTVTVYPVPYSNFSFIENYDNVQGQISFTNETIGGNDYFWLFGDGGDSEEDNPIYQYTEDGDYIIDLISWNEYDCADTMSYVYQFLFKGLFVPNAFAPGNPTSDVRVFQPKGVNLLQYDIKVYDNWGHLLWESQELDDTGCPSESWDGKYNDKLMPMDVYLWRIKATFVDGSVWEGESVGNNENGALETTGTVTLIR